MGSPWGCPFFVLHGFRWEQLSFRTPLLNLTNKPQHTVAPTVLTVALARL
jgi:hypothetical protein